MIRLKAENFRSFKELDLEIPAGKALFAGPNGSGKSNIAAAVSYAMIGQVPLAGEESSAGADDILTNGESEGFAEIEIVETHNYAPPLLPLKIRESRKNGNLHTEAWWSGQHLKGERSEIREQFLERLNLAGLRPREILGEWTRSVYLHPASKSIGLIGDTERIKYLMEVFRLEELFNLRDRIVSRETSINKNLLILNSQTEIEVEWVDIDALQTEIDKLSRSLKDVPHPGSIKDMENRLFKLQIDLDSLEKQCEKLIEHLRLREKRIAELHRILSELPKHDVTEGRSSVSKLQSQQAVLTSDVSKLKQEINGALLCPECESRLLNIGNELKSFDADEANRILQKKIEELGSAERDLSKHKQLLASAEQRDKLADELDNLESDKSAVISDNIHDSQRKRLAQELSELESNLNLARARQGDYEKLDKLRAKLNEVRITNEIFLENQKRKEEVKRLEKDKFRTSFILRTGLKMIVEEVINQRIGSLETEMNRILDLLGADGPIRFEISKNKEGIPSRSHIEQMNNGKWMTLSNPNYGEKSILRLGLSLGARNIYSKIGNFDLLMLDDPLDGIYSKAEAVLTGLGKLPGNVWVFSDHENAETLFQPDMIFQVRRDGNFSSC
jgi:DNA repair exonuclease SbcCD ATPase subunit